MSESLIKKVIEQKGLTVAELAERSGVSAETIHKLVSGRVAQPRKDYAEKIAKALGVKLSDISDFKDPD